MFFVRKRHLAPPGVDRPPPTVSSATPNSIPATQKQHSRDAPPAHHPAVSRSVVAAIGLLLADMPILPFFKLHSGSISVITFRSAGHGIRSLYPVVKGSRRMISVHDRQTFQGMALLTVEF